MLFLLLGSVNANCKNYRTINDSTRSINNRKINPSATLCDKAKLATGWYRFTGSGNGMIPRSPPAQQRCGTVATGWQTFANPTKVGQTTSGNFGFNYNGKTQKWTAEGKSMLCVAGGKPYYVYYLNKAPVCQLRYCTTNAVYNMMKPCKVSGWTKWGQCSKECGGGQKKRFRHITAQPKNGGAACPALSQARNCNVRKCTQHDVVTQHVDVVEKMIDAVSASHAGMDKSVSAVSKQVSQFKSVKAKAIADLTAIRDSLNTMKGKLSDKKAKLQKEDNTITAALEELGSKWTKLNSQQAKKLASAEAKREAHEKKITGMIKELERRRRLAMMGERM